MMNATNQSSTRGGNASASMRRISPRANNTLRMNGAKIAVAAEDSVKGQMKRVEDWI